MFSTQYFKKMVATCCGLISFCVHSGTVSLSTSGLEDLGPNARYEAWLVVAGSPASIGVFSVDNSGQLSQSVFAVSDSNGAAASAFILTIEPFPDANPLPADSRLLAGDVIDGIADIRIGHPEAIGDDLTATTGQFNLVNPTGDKGSSFDNGIWYISSPVTPFSAGLILPELPDGWVYEGWVVDTLNNDQISTGTFASGIGPDSDGAGPAAGLGSGLDFPGQDFINPARDLSNGYQAIVSVEPVPDNSPLPFTLKPLAISIENVFGTQTMDNNALASSPQGQVTINVGSFGSVQAVPVLSTGTWVLLLLLVLIFSYSTIRK